MTQPDQTLQLVTGGHAYAGWKTGRVYRSMEQCAGAYRLGVSEMWAGQDTTRDIRPGERCELRVGNETVIIGYVDTAELEIDSGSHNVMLTGRDATADLVDCSAVRKPGQWRGQRIERIAADLCKPFDVEVRTDVDTGAPLSSFALQAGETVFEAIERAARIRALLLMTDGKGALVITRAGVARCPTPLVLGGNILSARARLDVRDRFSQYTVLGQAPGSDYYNAASVSQIQAKATDPGVPRYRPLVLTNDQPDLAASLKQRAHWEANVRAARSIEVDVTVQGWRHAAGLWQPNTLVQVTAEALRLDDELLITAVEYSLDEQGSTTTLSLTRADAFSLLQLTEPQATSASSAWWNLPKPTAGGQ